MTANRDFWLAEHTNVSQTFQQFLGLYLKTFALYVAVVGVLFKFALDAQATPSLRRSLAVYLLTVSAVFGVAVVFAEMITRRLRHKRRRVLEHLGIPDEVLSLHWDEIVVGHWSSCGLGLFAVCVVFGVFLFLW